MSLHRRALAGALLIGAAAVALVGCSLTTAPPPVPASESSPATPQSAAPQTALPLDCAQLVPLAELQSQFVTPISVKVDETSGFEGETYAAFAQAGGSRCVWGGEDRTDGAWDQGLNLTVSASGNQMFSDWVAQQQERNPAGEVDTLGDLSWVDCQQAGDGAMCWVGVLVGDYWIDATMSDNGAPADAAAAMSWASELMAPVISSVESAGTPRGPWVPPADAFVGSALCDSPDAAAALLGVAGEGLTAGPTEPSDAITQSFPRPEVSCTWGTETTVSARITTLKGGAWAVDRMAADPSQAGGPLFADAERLTVPNTDLALVACGDGCWGGLSVGGSYVDVYAVDIFDVVAFSELLKSFGEQISGD